MKPPYKRRISLSLTPRQLDHIIAALREFQRMRTRDAPAPGSDWYGMLIGIAMEHGTLMSADEIDAFIEEINQ